ncbi:MAG TPA: histidine phosphatase family protein [Xanthomonadales bacterium]|nr:histidine phosphatase family protein [Xanthomonadales bacterium]
MKNDNYCIMYILRHGQSEANYPADIYGLDKGLTEKGKEQAKIAATKLKKIKFDIVFASPLIRAQETAAIIAAEHKLEVLTEKALKERFSGTLEGRIIKEVEEELSHLVEMRENLPFEEWKKIPFGEGRETDEQLISRFITKLREIAVAYAGKKVLIIGHVALMRTFLIHLGVTSYKGLKGKKIENTGYIKLKTDGIDFFVEELSGIGIELKNG